MPKTTTEPPEDLAAIVENGPRLVRLPVQSPSPIDEADAARLYELTDECAVGVDDEGSYVEFAEDAGVAERVLHAMRQAGFRTIFDALLLSNTLVEQGGESV